MRISDSKAQSDPPLPQKLKNLRKPGWLMIVYDVPAGRPGLRSDGASWAPWQGQFGLVSFDPDRPDLLNPLKVGLWL